LSPRTLHKAGAVKVYREKISGVAARRPQLEKLLRVITEGDVVLVTRLDRLARSTRDLLNILDKISATGAQFKSLRETWADTTTPVGKLMVTIIGGIAEFERELIRARTGDGIRRAKAAGVHMGRPPKLTKHQQREVLARLARGEETLVEIARTYNVSHMTISRLKTQHAAS
jgi:DNA invertase Pin-like site-specific DNA recombinase